MALLEEAIYTRLSGFAGLTALVGTRIYPDDRPHGALLPAVVFGLVTEIRHSALGTDTPIVRATYQFSCFAGGPGVDNGSLVSVNVKRQVQLALQRFRGTVAGVVIQDCFLQNAVALRELEIDVNHIAVDVEIIYEE